MMQNKEKITEELRAIWNAYVSITSNFHTKGENKMENLNLKGVTVKQINTAITDMAKAGLTNGQGLPAKAKKSAVAGYFIDQIKELNDLGRLDEIPEGAWKLYNTIWGDSSLEKIYDENTPIDTTTHTEAPTIPIQAPTEDPVKEESKSKTKYTKAMAFWDLLLEATSWDKNELAEELQKRHGKAALAEAKFWVGRYGEMLRVVGLVTVTKTHINIIER